MHLLINLTQVNYVKIERVERLYIANKFRVFRVSKKIFMIFYYHEFCMLYGPAANRRTQHNSMGFKKRYTLSLGMWQPPTTERESKVLSHRYRRVNVLPNLLILPRQHYIYSKVFLIGLSCGDARSI